MGLIINREKLTPEICERLKNLCPFGAISCGNSTISIGMGCKACMLCTKDESGAVTFEEEHTPGIDKSEYKGVAVYCEHYKGDIHGVTFELLGKARELASVTGQKVIAVMIGSNIKEKANELFCYGADEVYIYDNPGFENFLIETYSNAFEDFIRKVKPSSILVGATNIGRSLAPRVAARIGTGLTADCTSLEMTEDTDLVQIRPAFGGNIMARIMTPNHRPQFCTVRYKIFSKPERREIGKDNCLVKEMEVTAEMLKSYAQILDIVVKPVDIDISEADMIVQVGRGVKTKADLEKIKEFADSIGATMACTRPLVENGWFDAKHQIGLSGRTVKPKLLVTIGVSGAVQTVAGMKGSECIIAINTDPGAAIFDVANYGFVGDWYEILPELMKKIRKEAHDV